MTTADSREDLTFIGKGRSALVYKLEKDGQRIARKVFSGTDLTNVLSTLFYGAPIDYRWCDAAIQTAFYRRKVLGFLLKYWFDDQLTIADSLGVGVDDEHQAQYMDTSFVDGDPAGMYTPFSTTHIREYHELKHEIFPKLQKNLRGAGFDGTVWQTGYGQPCAIPNFLCRRDGEDGKLKWLWIDAESGVPAIASYDVLKLLGYYIPKALKFRRIMFDDLDCQRLPVYLDEHREALVNKLGQKDADKLFELAESLIEQDRQWHSESRFTRSVKYGRFKGKITEEEFQFYSQHMFRWYLLLLGFCLRDQLPKFISHVLKKAWSYISFFNPIKYTVFMARSIVSKDFRIRVSRIFVAKRVDEWRKMGRISMAQSLELRRELNNRDANQYLSDFEVFLVLKPTGYVVRAILLLLFPYWMLAPELFAAFFVLNSIILRLLYALVRCIEDIIVMRKFPYISVLIAPIPMFGTLAYPCQMMHDARKGHMISQFIIYEVFSTIVNKLPIWGGYSSEWEYRFNRLAFWFIRVSS